MQQTSPETCSTRSAIASAALGDQQYSPPLPPDEVAPEVAEELRALGYDLGRTVARGGFGVVYQARDREQPRDLAIKLILKPTPPAGSQQPHRETAALAALCHPNIVPLYAAGVLRSGIAYQVMPWIEGSSLRSRLARDAQLPISATLRIGIEVADALDAMHARGLVHRDVKPENVLLDGDRAILIDMGLVCAVRTTNAPTSESERLIGTPSYMSPEQWTSGAAIDGRADVYGLGCLLYELLTGALRHERNPLRSRGQNPFVWTESAHASDLLTAPYGDPWRTRPSLRRRRPDAPVALERLLYRALDPDRNTRLASATAFKHELEVIQRAQTGAPTPRGGLRALLQAAANLGRSGTS